MTNRTSSILISGLLAAGLFTVPVLADDDHGHDGDIYIQILDGQLVTGDFDDGLFEGLRVFEAEFEDFNFTDEPGFDSPTGAFSSDSAIGFNILSAVRRWDGTAFSTIATERIEVSYLGRPDILSPTDDTFTPGFDIDVNPLGEWHRHLGFTLQSPAGSGVYLLELELYSTDSTVGNSLPFWMVFDQDAPDGDHDAATLWVQQNLVPTPGALAAFGAAGLVALRRRR